VSSAHLSIYIAFTWRLPLTIFRCSGAFIKAIAINLQVPQQINSRNRLSLAQALVAPLSKQQFVANKMQN